jgi:perosamine synthetase
MIPYALAPAETRLSLSAIVRGALPVRAGFAEAFAAYLGVDRCVLANSGKTLLSLVFRTLAGKTTPGKPEILMPGYTCYSVAAAAVRAGMRIALYDLDPRTLQPDFQDVKRKISGNTLAVLGQHLLGVPADMAGLSDLADEHGICCIEDSAQLLEGADAAPRRKLLADYTIFSFGRGKPLPLGGGGALIGRDLGEVSKLADALPAAPCRVSEYVTPLAVRILAAPWLYWLPEQLPLGLAQPKFDPSFPMVQMPQPFRRIGAASIAGLRQFNQHRVAIGRFYERSFGGGVTSGETAHSLPYPRFPLLVDDRSDMDQVAEFGVRQIFPMPLGDLSDLRPHLVSPGANMPGVRTIADRLVTLPTHLAVTEKVAERLVRALRSVFRKIQTVPLDRTATAMVANGSSPSLPQSTE